MTSKYFDCNKVSEILKTYAEKCRNDKVQKIEYSTWCELKKASNGIVVQYQDKDAVIEFYTAQNEKSVEWIDGFDYSDDFGKWFYDNYLINDYTTIAAINYNYNPADTIKLNDISNSIVSTESYLNQHIEKAQKLLEKRIDEEMNKYLEKEKEKDSMKGFNFNFGPCTDDNIKMSVYGLAIKNAGGEWVSYDTKSGQIMNVDLLNFDGRKFMFKMPVAIKDIEKGNVVVHNRVPMFVLGVTDDGVIAVDVHAGEEKKILPTNSPFGFNFVTKVVSMFNAFDGAPTPDAPFGNFLPFMMMGEDNEIDPFVMCMIMQSMGNAQCGNMFNNPMMMYFLMKDSDAQKDLIMPMLMMQAMGQPASEVVKSSK